MAYDTFGVQRGVVSANPNTVTYGTLDLGTVQNQGSALATDSTSLTAISGSLTAAMTLGATITSGEITLIGSLATEAANIATESGSITVAAGTVTSDIFVAVLTGSSANNLDVRQALATIENYLLSSVPVGALNPPVS